MSSLSPDQVAFVRLCHVIVDHVPQSLRETFLDKFTNQTKKQWDTALSGKWFLQNDKFTSKLIAEQKQLIEAGDVNKWDMTILSHALLYSSHFLLISSPPLQGLKISQNSKSEITSSACPDLSQSVKKGETLLLYSGSNISIVEVDTVSQSVIKINKQINLKGCFQAHVCSDQWYLIKELSGLRNTKYAHCKAAVITESELLQVMEKVKNVYEKLNLSQDCIQSLQDILQERIIEPSEIKRYQEEWKKIYDDSSSSSDNEEKRIEHTKASREVAEGANLARHADLIAALETYMHDLDTSGINFDSAITLIKFRIENYINKSLEDGIAYDEVNIQIQDLMTKALIPADIFGWCEEMLKECKKVTQPTEEVSASSKTPPNDVQSLFCKDVVHHASVCCNVITEFSRKKFPLKDIFKDHRHNFKHASISSDGSLLTAEKDDVMYFAFVAENMQLFRLGAIKNYNTKLPQRYLTELLRQGKRLVFTGFSRGSEIARSIVMSLWNSTLNTAKTLSDNVTCILFGPIAFYIDEPISCPQLLKTFHSFIIKDDAVSKLSHVFRLYGLNHEDYWLEDGFDMDQIIFATRQHLRREFQERMHPYDGYFGNIYLIAHDKQSLYWKRLDDVHREHLRLTEDYLNKLSPDNFSQHKMSNYQVIVQRGYLEKEVSYAFPEEKRTISDIISLRPKLETLEVHCQEHPDGRELTLIFNGDNMWFTQKFEVSFAEPLKFCVNPEDVSQKQIQYCHGEIFTDIIANKSVTQCEVKVESTFLPPFTKEVILVFKVPDPISFRQSQLAKQNPSEIIKLSFLSALLELAPYSQGSSTSMSSKRFVLIVSFLQQAAGIVPLESILFAIASCSSDETMKRYVQACAQYLSTVPCSKVMEIGYEKAQDRIFSGKITTSSQYDLVEEVSHLEDMNCAGVCAEYKQSFPLAHIPRHQYSGRYKSPYFSIVSTDLPHYSRYPRTITHSVSRQVKTRKKSKLKVQAVPMSVDPMVFFMHHPNKFRSETFSKLICDCNIGEIYPVNYSINLKHCKNTLKSLPQILHDGRKKLADLSFAHNDKIGLGDMLSPNGKMLQLVNEIVQNDLEPCVSMLGGFMEQHIRIPLVNNPKDTAEAFDTSEVSGAVGVWALFALGRSDIESILCGSQGSQTFVVQIAQFIQGVLNEAVKPRHIPHPVSSYEGKLQFLLQGLTNTVSCSSHYISYTLERELVQLCSTFKITPKSKVQELISNWDDKFKETALALVPNSHRPLVARWIIWALNIHQLREGLSKYISIGIIGLVNSGKSTLVKKLFRKEAVSGTFQSARTITPFIYNMDDSVEGLGVIDFPGVDDRDESIKGLAKLLVELAQIVVFVCSYDTFHTIPAKEWTTVFHNELSSTPILVCLTHADRLCEESEDYIKLLIADECKESEVQDMTRRFDLELKEIVKEDLPSNCTAKFCTLTQSRFSPLNSEKSKKIIRKTGIFTPEDIGDWIIDAVKTHLQQSDLAERLSIFFADQTTR